MLLFFYGLLIKGNEDLPPFKHRKQSPKKTILIEENNKIFFTHDNCKKTIGELTKQINQMQRLYYDCQYNYESLTQSLAYVDERVRGYLSCQDQKKLHSVLLGYENNYFMTNNENMKKGYRSISFWNTAFFYCNNYLLILLKAIENKDKKQRAKYLALQAEIDIKTVKYKMAEDNYKNSLFLQEKELKKYEEERKIEYAKHTIELTEYKNNLFLREEELQKYKEKIEKDEAKQKYNYLLSFTGGVFCSSFCFLLYFFLK
jgi:hypothetical protein